LELSADRHVAYEFHPIGLLRLAGRGSVAQREIYRLPRGWTVSFQELAEKPLGMLRMEVFSPAPATNAPNVPRLTCEAVLGSDPEVALAAGGKQ
jgi:hypothetical protein